jgi:protein TonB
MQRVGEMAEFRFETFEVLENQGRSRFALGVGTSFSLVYHATLVILLFVLPARELVPMSEGEDGDPNGGRRIQIIELKGPFYAPPPEVIRQLAQARPDPTPERPQFLAEKSSIARGERNPNPSGDSTLPKGSGGTGRLPEAKESQSEGPSKTDKPSRREVTNSPRMAPSLPAPTASGEQAGGSKGKTDLQESLIAALKNTGSVPPPPEKVGSQQSGVTVEGSPSVNAQGVAAMEEYRAYLERAIQQRWFLPPETHLLEGSVTVEVVFEVTREGRLGQVHLRRSSGNAALDRAALNAVRLASPFRPLPNVYLFQSQLFTDKFTYYPPRG